MSTSPSSSSAADAAGIPAIRTFQLDGSAIGRLSSAVNLFRGDVNLPQSLFSMPGRHRGSGLDVDVTAIYQSNVYRDASTWNRDAPTGVLGLGWSLPLTCITATDNGSPDPDTWTYVLYDNGNPNALIPQPAAPFLFPMPGTLAGGLASGQPVPADVQTQFQLSGLPLGAGAMVSGGPGTWTVDDPSLQQVFTIETAGSALDVSWGGKAFQLQNYHFWQIVYFPEYCRWLIVDDHGIRRSLGGVGPDTSQGYKTAVGNSIAWQVWWGRAGTPIWTGPSMVAAGQMQVPRAWYLASTSNAFGDTVTYVYNGWSRNSAGLLPEVEQQVAVGGLPYTKAVYLTQVTDLFGRTATLNYGEKLIGDGDPTDAAPREYADPHRPIPSNEPNAYQDCYETKYLDNIAVADSTGALLLTVQLGYVPSPSASGPAQAVANVTSFTGALEGDTYKRYLTSITIQNADGDALPGYRYDYYLNASAPGAQPGALATVTAQQGGSATYTYTLQPLAVCDRDQPIPLPSGDLPGGGVPRVFYGDDYVVSVWYDAPDGILSVQVFTWMGGWIGWQLDPATTVLDTGGLELSTLDVLANPDFFVVYFLRSGSAVAYVFNKDSARPGQFVPAVIGDVTTAKNVPSLTVPFSLGTVTVVGGTTFFAIGQLANTPEPYQLLTWRWTTQSWTAQTVPPTANPTFLAAAGEYLLAVDSQGNVVLSYLDGTLTWQQSTGTGAVSAPVGNYQNVALVAGSGCAALSVLTESLPQRRAYDVTILQWDANHLLQPPATGFTFVDLVGEGVPAMPWTPAIVSPSLVAINGNLLRFDGSQWRVTTIGPATTPLMNEAQRYAYGPD